MSANSEQRNLLSLIKGSVEGKHTVKELALRLGLSERRVKQIKSAYKQHGNIAVIHGNKGRKPPNAIADELSRRIVNIKRRSEYKDMNFSNFKKCLESDFGINVSYGTLHSILTANGCVSRHRHRECRASFGELLQTYSIPHDWFGTGECFALQGFIDDATGKIMGLHMSEDKCLLGYLEALRTLVKKQGVPMEIYVDKNEIFCVKSKKLTQLGQILETLGISPIFAISPKAKAKIEIMQEALQNSVAAFFKKHEAKTIEQANKILPKFIYKHNSKFSLKPADKHSCFVSVPKEINLDTLLTVKHDIITDKCGAFSLMNMKFQVEADENIVNKKITFMFSDKIGLVAKIGKKFYPVKNSVVDADKKLFSRCYLKNGHSRNIQGNGK
jgi:transposase